MGAVNHFSALMKKNFILWRRNCCCACLEILIPVFFMFILVLVRATVKDIKENTLDFTPAAIPVVAVSGENINLTTTQQ